MAVAPDRPQHEPLPDNAPHVLVVDDDQRIRDLLARFLLENGFRVTHGRRRRRRARGDARPRLRSRAARRDDARRERPRRSRATSRRRRTIPICMLTALRRRRAPHRGSRSRRRRLPAEAVRAARTAAAAAATSCGAASAAQPAARRGPHGRLTSSTSARGELKRGDETIKLTERERDLLRLFAQRAGMPIARHELAERR